MASDHILSSFDHALGELRRSVLDMARQTEGSLQHATQALVQGDDDLAVLVIANEQPLEELGQEVDRLGVSILLRFQPVARDLREVIAAMRLGSNLKRIGAETAGIARRIHRLEGKPALASAQKLGPMFQAASGLLQDSLRPFTGEEPASLEQTLRERSAALDAATRQTSEELTEAMSGQDRETVQGYLELIHVARALERIGDHATNIVVDGLQTRLRRPTVNAPAAPIS